MSATSIEFVQKGITLNIANILTSLRIFIGPIFLLIYLYPAWFGLTPQLQPFALLFLMVIVELSDALDGYYARRYNQVSNLGKILDPMADSIARLSIFFTLTQGAVALPLLLVFVFFYRDSIVSTLRTVCALRGFALAARKSGKLKAILQAIVAFAIIIMMIPHAYGYLSTEKLQSYSLWLVSFVALYAVISALDYFWVNREHIRVMVTEVRR
jgi:CDP-diacylglycerol---glycerol-3-phosphate 3-phosphatidyltransferase